MKPLWNCCLRPQNVFRATPCVLHKLISISYYIIYYIIKVVSYNCALCIKWIAFFSLYHIGHYKYIEIITIIDIKWNSIAKVSTILINTNITNLQWLFFIWVWNTILYLYLLFNSIILLKYFEVYIWILINPIQCIFACELDQQKHCVDHHICSMANRLQFSFSQTGNPSLCLILYHYPQFVAILVS